MLDLVLNHVAREHEWARRARAGEPALPRLLPRLPRPRPARRLRAHPAGGLPRLRPGQLHLGRRARRAGSGRRSTSGSGTSTGPTPTCWSSSPTIVLYLANLGVEVLRLDAIAFLVEAARHRTARTSPRCTRVTQALRAVARIACPALAFKAEAIVGPRDLVQYLGQGQHAGRVSDLAYHNSLMVQVWSMLATGSTGSPAQRSRRCRRRRPTRHVDHLRPLPRRHRVGHRRRRRRRRRASTATRTAASCRTGTPATSRARGRAGWSSSTTPPPATSGSAAPRQR